MPGDVRIRRTFEVSSYDDLGKPKAEMLVEFNVGDDGPFTKRFPSDGFSAASARVVIDTFARDLAQLRGQ